MERTTKELELPSGAKAVIKAYLTTREMLPLMKAPTAGAVATAAENIDKGMKMLELALVSINGSAENMMETLQDFPVADYLFLQKEVAEIVNFQKTKN